MTSELQQYYDGFCRAYWSHQDPKICACHGSGWALSEVDTWHQCPQHYNGQRHPEDDLETVETPIHFDGDLRDLYALDPREAFTDECEEAPF